MATVRVKRGAIVPLNSPTSTPRQIPSGKFEISKFKANRSGGVVKLRIEAEISDAEILNSDEEREESIFARQANLPFKPSSTITEGDINMDNVTIILTQTDTGRTKKADVQITFTVIEAKVGGAG
jgi:hypothetical protein